MLPVNGVKADHADGALAIEYHGVKAVALVDLRTRRADEPQRARAGLLGRPREPPREVTPVRLDERIQIVHVGLLENAQGATVRQGQPRRHLRGHRRL